MGMNDPLPTFTALVERVRDAHPNLAYFHAVEPRIDGVIGSDLTDDNRTQSNEALRKAWGDRPYIAAGGINGATAMKMVEKYGGLVAFGRDFIANVSRVLRSQSVVRFLRTHFSLISLCV
jgi:NADPH2 dehydrogenase